MSFDAAVAVWDYRPMSEVWRGAWRARVAAIVGVVCSVGCGGAPGTGVIAFDMASGAVDGSRHLWAVAGSGDPDTLRALTSGPRRDSGVTISPDGRLIAFQRALVTDPSRAVVVVRGIDGGPEVEVPQPDEPVVDEFPFWAPGGGLLGFTRMPRTAPTAGTSRLYVVPVVAGLDRPVLGEVTRLSGVEGLSRLDASWNPRGSEVAFMWEAPDGYGPFGIGVVSFPGAAERMVVPPRGRFSPAWSPDGERIAWLQKDATDISHLVLARADGSDVTRVTCGEGWDYFDWSPAGDQFVVTSSNDPMALWTVPAPALGGACAEPTVLVRLPRAVGQPSWR